MSDFETWKMMWRDNAWNPQGRSDVIDAVCARGNAEALKWFWKESSWSPDYRSRIIDAVCDRGDAGALKWFWNESSWNPEWREKIQTALLRNNRGRDSPKVGLYKVIKKFKYHAFICHASEDNLDFVTPLANELRYRNVNVWYDQFTLKLGDSLRQKIDEGLRDSRYGIVVLSKAFFSKNWPQLELDGLVSKEVEGEKVILPIWHGVTRNEVAQYSPILSGRVASLSSKGLHAVVNDILDVIFE